VGSRSVDRTLATGDAEGLIAALCAIRAGRGRHTGRTRPAATLRGRHRQPGDAPRPRASSPVADPIVSAGKFRQMKRSRGVAPPRAPDAETGRAVAASVGIVAPARRYGSSRQIVLVPVDLTAGPGCGVDVGRPASRGLSRGSSVMRISRSRYLQGIDNAEIIQAVHDRPEPMITASRRLGFGR
jgi:hypothetical protein